jgi:hypothetical protein
MGEAVARICRQSCGHRDQCYENSQHAGHLGFGVSGEEIIFGRGDREKKAYGQRRKRL